MFPAILARLGEAELALAVGLSAGAYMFHRSYDALRQHRYLSRHGETAEGEVTALVPVYDAEDPDTLLHHAPLISFNTPTGVPVTVRYGGGGSLLGSPQWQVGQRVQLRYHPPHPQEILLPAHREPNEDGLYTALLLSTVAIVFSIMFYLS